MPTITQNKDRSTSNSNTSSPNPGSTTRPNTRRNGPPPLLEDHQDVKDPLEGRKYLEKYSLLCPPGEPPTHQSLTICLHQISALAGVPKQAVNAIRSVAFLLGELEDSQINITVRDALDSQMTEFTSDFKMLIEDAKERIDEHAKASEKRLASLAPPPTQSRSFTSTYASVLVNPPAYANPKVATREGIKARQFMIQGLNETKLSHLNPIQLKAEVNKILSELGSPAGKIRSIVISRSGGTVIEADTDEVAAWLSNSTNQGKLCEKLGPKAEFRTRSYNIIAFNVPTDIDPEVDSHRLEICEANGLDPTTIVSAKWAKAVDKRSPNQRTAHLLLSLDDANAANRAITNGLLICNRKCQVERTRKEPIRCLKCQGWNHFARDCITEKDICGNCAGFHRTSSCRVNERSCVLCKANDHASWSRACPTFVKKIAEFNARNPDNSLQYFPTADAWTWSMVDKPAAFSAGAPVPIPIPTPVLATQVQGRPSKTRLGKRPQHARTQGDTYMPTDTYIPDYSTQFSIPEYGDPFDWANEVRPSNPRPSSQVAPPSTQLPCASGSIANSNTNPYTSND